MTASIKLNLSRYNCSHTKLSSLIQPRRSYTQITSIEDAINNKQLQSSNSTNPLRDKDAKLGILREELPLPNQIPLSAKMTDGSYFIIHERKTKSPKLLPPPIHKPHTGSQRELSKTDFAEIAKLRESKPDYWTVTRLAERFGCSKLQISINAPCPEHRLKAIKDQAKASWSRSGAVYKAKILRRKIVRKQEGW